MSAIPILAFAIFVALTHQSPFGVLVAGTVAVYAIIALAVDCE